MPTVLSVYFRHSHEKSNVPEYHFSCVMDTLLTLVNSSQVGFEYDQLTFVNMILGFARAGRHRDVLVMFKGLEALTRTSSFDGEDPSRQKGYWGCHNEALKACEVRTISSLESRTYCSATDFLNMFSSLSRSCRSPLQCIFIDCRDFLSS